MPLLVERGTLGVRLRARLRVVHSLPQRSDPAWAQSLAKVEAIVTKSISGHQTERMRERYSTVTPEEQRRSIGNVVQLFGPRPPQSGEGSGEGDRVSGEGAAKSGRG